MLALAEQNEPFRKDLENLAKAYLRLAEYTDRNAQMDLPFEPEGTAAHQRQQSEQILQQQQPRS